MDQAHASACRKGAPFKLPSGSLDPEVSVSIKTSTGICSVLGTRRAGPRGDLARGNGSPWGEVTAESHTRRDSILAPAYLALAPIR